MDLHNHEPQTGDSHSGLCGLCLHVRQVRSSHGSTFYLCRRSEADPRFARYPRLPVINCKGFEPREEPSAQ